MDGFDESDIEFEEDNALNIGPVSVEKELEKFRQKWKEEISKGPAKLPGELSSSVGNVSKEDCVNGNVRTSLLSDEGPSIEEQARFLFLQGVSAEQSGKFYDAIQFYRRAIQLVPDIEFKIGDEKPRKPKKERTISECSVDSTGSALGEDEDPEDLEDLLGYFQKLKITENGLCSSQFHTRSTHISALPVELLNYIFKWVVSSEIDVVSLEHLSMVSRGFYVCSRDEELWRLICQKVWGRNRGDATNYGSYRNMYYQRPHIRLNGLYISKCCYYRQGEKGMDIFYKPYHLVEYYRYVRFFPEGHVVLFTSPEEPKEVVNKLRTPYTKMQGIQAGYYRITGDLITAVLKRQNIDFRSPFERFRRKNRNEIKEEQTFNVEFHLCSSGKRQHSQLVWNHYSHNNYIKTTGEKRVTEFELNNKNYPPLIFSRVKSYTATAHMPLN